MRRDVTMRSFARAGAGVVLGTAAAAGLLTATSGLALAAGNGYGPAATNQTGPANVPGGFASVVLAQKIPRSGGLVNVLLPGAHLNITIPRGAFRLPVELEVTKPNLSSLTKSLPSLGLSSYLPVGGTGISVLLDNGRQFSGRFGRPLAITLAGAKFGLQGERVVELTGPTSFLNLPTVLSPGRVTFSITADPDVVVLAPTRLAAATVVSTPRATSVPAGATSVHTGKPFLGEGIAAGVLALTGAILVAVGLRRRRSDVSHV